MDCIFCKIIAGEIPSFKVYEDDATLCFMDINPVSDGHVLVIPKKHFNNLFDGDEAALAAVMATACKVARALRDSLKIDSMNMVQANGVWAVQSVPHYHVHLIPRRENDGVGLDWPLVQGDFQAIEEVGKSIANAIA